MDIIMEQLFVANFRIDSPALAQPTLAVNLSVDTVHGTLCGHATIAIGEVRRPSVAVEGFYLPLEGAAGAPGVLSLRTSRSMLPVMFESQLELLIALPKNWDSGKASFTYTDGRTQEVTKVCNSIATSCPCQAIGAQ